MLINDTATIATEVPVYMNLGGGVVTGHIDILQIRFEKLHVIDYKPQAEKEKTAASQVYLYALGLSKATGIPLRAFVCAYFDDKDCYEFHPVEVHCPLRTEVRPVGNLTEL